MKKNFKMFLLMASLIIISITKVNAETVYTNERGIKLSKDEYNEVKKSLDDISIRLLTQQDLDLITSGNAKITNEKKYFLTTTIYDENDVAISTLNSEITKEKYDEFDSDDYNQQYLLDYETNSKIETNAKVLDLTVISPTFASRNISVYSTLTWKNIPKVKSFDVIATMFKIPVVMNDFMGMQISNLKSSSERITEYNPGGTNSKVFTNGVGVSMNIHDDVTESLALALQINATVDSAGSIYTSYQHATSTVTLEQSKGYTLSEQGLGHVINFTNSSVRNKYDGMEGTTVIYSTISVR